MARKTTISTIRMRILLEHLRAVLFTQTSHVKAPHQDRPEYHLEDFARPLV